MAQVGLDLASGAVAMDVARALQLALVNLLCGARQFDVLGYRVAAGPQMAQAIARIIDR